MRVFTVNEYQVFLNGSIGVAALCVAWLIMKGYMDIMKNLVLGLREDLKAHTDAIKRLTAAFRSHERGKK